MLKNNDMISIIISAYNTEKYIEKCINSLTNQTYKNIEIIVIDDCSRDNTYNILNEIAKKDSRIKIFRNEVNSGLSYSRNFGLKQASGNYIGYIDSDDYVNEDYYQKLYDVLILNDADIVVCDMNLIYEKNQTQERVSACLGDANALNIINNGLAASACNKLFKKEIISENLFSVGKVNEDLAVILPAIVKAKKLAYTDEVYYNYVQRDNSIQNSKFSFKKFDIFYGVDLTLERIKNCKQYESIKDAIVFNQLVTLLLYVVPKEKSFWYRLKILRQYHKLIKKYNLLSNKYFLKFISSLNKKNQLYYKYMVRFTNNGLCLLSDLLICFYQLYKKLTTKTVIDKNITLEDLVKYAKKQQSLKQNGPTISVVVPNYNYEKFLYQRIYSILYQNYKISELIILDDCSKDSSRKIIDEIVDNISPYLDVKKVYNEVNSGSSFKQWEKGFDYASKDYVWIAEADDYCDKFMLKKIVKNMNDNTIISYVDTAFIDAVGTIFMKTIKSEIDIMHTGHWNKSYINSGEKEFNNYTFLNCTIANVSSCIIKNGNYKKYFKISGNYKQAGDWLFYANIMHLGDVAYYNKPLNYYRVHGNNVSSVTKKEAHMNEIKSIHSYYDNTYKLNKIQKQEIENRYEFLRKVWNLKSK